MGFSQIRNRTCVPCISRWVLYHWVTKKASRPSSLNGGVYCNSPSIQFALLCSSHFLNIFIISERSLKPICSLSPPSPPPSPWQSLIHFVSRFVYSGMFHINEIIRYVAFHDWLPKSLKKKSLINSLCNWWKKSLLNHNTQFNGIFSFKKILVYSQEHQTLLRCQDHCLSAPCLKT